MRCLTAREGRIKVLGKDMRKLEKDNEIFGAWFDSSQKAAYHPIFSIKESSPIILASDEKAYIAAQGDENSPMWVFFRSLPGDFQAEELCDIILSASEKNSDLHIISDYEALKPILDRLCEKSNKTYRVYMRQNAYICNKPIKLPLSGHMVLASEDYYDDINRLIRQMIFDSVKREIDDREANDFVKYAISSGNVFLWDDGGIKSMANVAYKIENCARVNTIVNDRNARGMVYAGMLVSTPTEKLSLEGKTKVIYADRDYPPSNKTYKKIGFKKCGEVCDFYLSLRSI